MRYLTAAPVVYRPSTHLAEAFDIQLTKRYAGRRNDQLAAFLHVGAKRLKEGGRHVDRILAAQLEDLRATGRSRALLRDERALDQHALAGGGAKEDMDRLLGLFIHSRHRARGGAERTGKLAALALGLIRRHADAYGLAVFKDVDHAIIWNKLVNDLAADDVLIVLHLQLGGNIIAHLPLLTKIKGADLGAIDLAAIGKEQDLSAVVGVLLVDDVIAFLELMLIGAAHRLCRQLLEVSAARQNQAAGIILEEQLLGIDALGADGVVYDLGLTRLAVFGFDGLQLLDDERLELQLIAQDLLQLLDLRRQTP